MERSCSRCRRLFLIRSEDLDFLRRASPVIGGKQHEIPPPTQCPDCRQRRRISWRNEINFYRRSSDLSGVNLISLYSADKPYPVYSHDEWWSDHWDARDYGRDYDPGRGFFDQFRELQLTVPRIALYGKMNENSEFTNHTDHVKSCYLAVNIGHSERLYYCRWMIYCHDCIDCSNTLESELCYEVTNSRRCYGSTFLDYCEGCSESHFLYDCKGCSCCLLSSGLRNKRHYVLNQSMSPERYGELIATYVNGSFQSQREASQRFHEEVLVNSPHRATTMVNCESCVGDDLFNSRKLFHCYNLHSSEDCAYCYDAASIADCYDATEPAFQCELQYETQGCNRGRRTLFSSVCYDVDSVVYCDSCHNSSNLFGCIGVRREQHCVLNKQYSEGEYGRLVQQILADMSERGEWGEFFPLALSPFAYNETIAQDFFPSSERAVKAEGGQWCEDYQEPTPGAAISTLPDSIAEVPDALLEDPLQCITCARPFRVIQPELLFYRRQGIPIPRSCATCRRNFRLNRHRPRRLTAGICSNCNGAVETTLAGGSKQALLCPHCYEAGL